MPKNPKMQDGQSTAEELIEIDKGVEPEPPSKEEVDELTKELGDDEKSDEPAT